MRTQSIIKLVLLPAALAVASLSVCRAESTQAPDSLKKGAGISIRTNLLWDAVSEPNLGIEFPLSDHWSLGVDAGLKAWPRWLAWDWNTEDPKHWRNFAIVPEVRYYLNQVYQGLFFGADALYTHFNVGAVTAPFHMYPEVEQYREQGSYWAGGLLAGYAWWPWQHWRLELEAGAALGLAAYEKFDCPHCGTKVGDERKVAVVPKLAVNIAYNPVPRKEAERRRALRHAAVISGTDTITVLTPPVAFVVHLHDVKAPQTDGDRLAKEEPWVIPIEKYRPLDYLTRPGRDSIMFVRFPVNSWELKPEFAPNADVLDRLSQAIRRIAADERTSEILVSIVGLASIEGPQDRNDTLSVRRARAVADYLNAQTGVSRRYFETIGKGEAWDWFKAQLEAIPDGGEGLDAAQVKTLLDIVYNEPDADARERSIKAQKQLYPIVRDRLLADQRNSGYIRVYYNNAPDPATEQYNQKVLPLLKAKRYHDAVRVLESDPALKERTLTDAEAANAYGIALYFTALDNKADATEKEALEMIERAAALGSDAARENLEGIKVYGPARREYEAWQEAMKDNN